MLLSYLAEPIIYIPAVVIAMFAWWVLANRFLWFDFYYTFPLKLFGNIGKLKRLKDATERADDRRTWKNGMSEAENTLCADYSGHIKAAQSHEKFENAREYLAITNQAATRPLPAWRWGVLFLLTMGEAVGTGFLISPWVSSKMSAHDIQFAGWIIAGVLATVLLLVTHKAGHSAKKRVAILHGVGKLDKNARPPGAQGKPRVRWDTDQCIDEGADSDTRFFLRVMSNRDRGSWALTIVAAILLGGVLGGVFYIRWEGIRQQNTRSVAAMEKNGLSGASTNPFAGMSGSNGSALPPAVRRNQMLARKAVAIQIGSEELGQGLGAAGLLAFLYVLTQAVGFLFAFDSAFVGEGARAYEATGGESDYDALLRKHVTPFVRRASARLEDLRHSFILRMPLYAEAPPTSTFEDYFRREQDQPHVADGRASASAVSAQTAASGPRPTASASLAPMASDLTQTSTPVATQGLATEIVMFGVANKEGAKARLTELRAKMDPVEFGRLLALMKEEKARQAALDGQINDIFET